MSPLLNVQNNKLSHRSQHHTSIYEATMTINIGQHKTYTYNGNINENGVQINSHKNYCADIMCMIILWLCGYGDVDMEKLTQNLYSYLCVYMSMCQLWNIMFSLILLPFSYIICCDNGTDCHDYLQSKGLLSLWPLIYINLYVNKLDKVPNESHMNFVYF